MTESAPQESDPMLADIQRQLDEIGPRPMPCALPVAGPSFLAPDPNDPDVIIHPVKLTRYDKAIRKLRDLEAKSAGLPANHDPRKVAVLNHQIDNARKAVKAAQDDVTRLRERIDEWRADTGREVYNASRRKVRSEPNADLSHLTPDERKQRQRDQRSDANWLKRRRKAKVPENQIQAELVVRIREREAKRAETAMGDLEHAAMEALPNFGMF